MSVFVFFGPPASRKSTLIRCIPELLPKCVVLDLERASNVHQAFLLNAIVVAKFDCPVFVTAAELHKYQIPRPCDVTFLRVENKEKYLQYLRERNKQFPEKSDQGAETLYDDMSAIDVDEFDRVIDPISLGLDDLKFAEHVLKTLNIPFTRYDSDE